MAFNGCLMVYFDIDNNEWKQFVEQSIDKDDVYEQEGLEYQPHVTVLYGLEDPNLDKLKGLIKETCVFPTVRVVGLSVFESSEFDVLKFDVEAPGLANLNKEIKENFSYQNKYNEYKPHITIAYLKKGTYKKYIDDSNIDFDLNPSSFVYSDGEKGERIKRILIDLEDFKKGDYFYRINDLISKAEDGSEKTNERIRKKLNREFEQFSMQGKVTIGYRYCDREENRLRGRVGAFAGWRVTTRAFKFMPPNVIPETRSPNKTAVRYYDFGRADWRSYRKEYFVVMSSFWNDKTKEWVDTPEAAGFKRTWKNDNDKYKKDPDFFDAELYKKKLKAIEKDIKKRKEQIAKQKLKENKIEKAMNHKYLWREFKDGEHIYHYNVLHPKERKTKQDERVDAHLDIDKIPFDQFWNMYKDSVKKVIFTTRSKINGKHLNIYYVPEEKTWYRGSNVSDREKIEPNELKRLFNVNKKGESELVLKNLNYKEGSLDKINNEIRKYYESRISDFLKEVEKYRSDDE